MAITTDVVGLLTAQLSSADRVSHIWLLQPPVATFHPTQSAPV